MNCACCDIELTDSPTISAGKAFCCAGCADGGPCVCAYEDRSGQHPRNGHADPLLMAELLQPRFTASDDL